VRKIGIMPKLKQLFWQFPITGKIQSYKLNLVIQNIVELDYDTVGEVVISG
jgi:hypothetical protein